MRHAPLVHVHLVRISWWLVPARIHWFLAGPAALCLHARSRWLSASTGLVVRWCLPSLLASSLGLEPVVSVEVVAAPSVVVLSGFCRCSAFQLTC